MTDTVVVMLASELLRRSPSASAGPRRAEPEVWAPTPHLYAVSARPDLIANIGRALAEGLRALAPARPRP